MSRLVRKTILRDLAFYFVNLILQVGTAVFLTFMFPCWSFSLPRIA